MAVQNLLKMKLGSLLFIVLSLVMSDAVGQYTGAVNYIRSWEAIKPVTNGEAVNAGVLPRDFRVTTQYLDGLGRPVQTVVKQGAPNTGSSAVDLVSNAVYDEFGRERLKYLPFAASGSAANVGQFQVNGSSQQNAFYTGTNSPVAGQGETFFYGQTNYEATPLNRITETFAPGNSWVGTASEPVEANRHSTKLKYHVNTSADLVRKWIVSDASVIGDWGTITTPANDPGFYAQGELQKTIVADEHNKQVIEFKDKNGQVILKKVQLTATADNGSGAGYDGWLCTYYLYDKLGLLRCVIQPEGVKAIVSNWNPSANSVLLNEQCFRYEYDQRQRMIRKKVPGAGDVWMIYDHRDRMVFMQDAKMRIANQWLATLYDELNRPVMTGMMTLAVAPAALQTMVNTLMQAPDPGSSVPASLILTEPDDSGLKQASVIVSMEVGFSVMAGADLTAEIVGAGGAPEYSPVDGVVIYKNPIPAGAPFIALTKTYYDNYQFTHRSFLTTWHGYFDPLPSEYPETLPQQASPFTKGFVTGSAVRILSNPENLAEGAWMTTVSYYDDKGRPVQIQSDNHKGGADIVTTQYDFAGNVLMTYQSSTITGQAPLYVKTRMKYDDLGRVIEVSKTLNNDDQHKAVISQVEYDGLGQIKAKLLGRKKNTDGSYTASPLETLSNTYNIRGWLKGINKEYANTGSGGAQANRWFGMELLYDQADAASQYNGNIGAIKWHSRGAGDLIRQYGFAYDAANRLLKADFSQQGTMQAGDAPVNFNMRMGDGLDPTSAYDANGNILKMSHWGLKLAGSEQIDELKYTYGENGLSNKLKNVVDLKNDVATTLGDFRTAQGHPQLSAKNTYASTGAGDLQAITDYSYDVNGNLSLDKNKNIASISYNHLNLPWQITVNDDNGNAKGRITYVYDAAGNKLQKKTQEYGPDHQTVARSLLTDYTGARVYETKEMSAEPSGNYADKLQFLGHEEGRIRPVFGNSSDPSQITGFEYDYMVKDHLGNVRMVLTEERRTDLYPVASLEEAKLSIEDDYYQIDQSKIVAASSLAQPPSSYTNDNGVGNNPVDPTFGAQNSERLYRLKGDENKMGLGITLKVMAGDELNILGKSYWYQNTQGVSSGAAPTVLNLLEAMLGSPSAALTGAHATAASLHGISGVTSGVGSFLSSPGREDASYPYRPRAFINYIFFDEQFRYAGGNVSPVSSEAGLKTHNLTGIVVPKNGYVYIYCSNESAVPVFFDNLQVGHVRGAMLEESHYYPFGLTMAGISSKAVSFGGAENKHGYNNIEQENDLNIEVYSARYRKLDHQSGRWWQIDPKSDTFYAWSPYNLNFDDPIKYADPFGDDPILKALAKKGIEWAARTLKGAFKPISREQAVSLLKKGKGVYATNDNAAKAAKKLMKEGGDGAKIVRHDGHQLKNGKIGKDHYQKKAGDGSHVFYSALPFLLPVSGATDEAASNSTFVDIAVENTVNGLTGSATTSFIGKATGLNKLGKKIVGDNAFGRFLDDWINPFN